jgi:hypothetical protein
MLFLIATDTLLVGLPGGDRTPDPQLRRLMLYPTELRAETKADIKKAHKVSFF